jgi:hypothetical protein
MDQRHEMVLERTHPSGAEDWYCPTCGRRMSITWQPWKKIVLEPGDTYAAHSGSKGGLEMGPLQVSQGEGSTPTPLDGSLQDPYLAPWLRWMDQFDSDDLWNRGAS